MRLAGTQRRWSRQACEQTQFNGFPRALRKQSKEQDATDSEGEVEKNENGKEGDEPKTGEVDEEKEKNHSRRSPIMSKEFRTKGEQLNKNNPLGMRKV